MRTGPIWVIDIERNPRAFTALDRRAREAVSVGDLVKLAFGAEVGGQWLWVKVVEVADTPAGRIYVGLLSEPPLRLPMKVGERVSFGPHNILDIDRS